LNGGFNGFTWLLLAFPIYLLSKGRFVDYMSVASSKEQAPAQKGGATGSW